MGDVQAGACCQCHLHGQTTAHDAAFRVADFCVVNHIGVIGTIALFQFLHACRDACSVFAMGHHQHRTFPKDAFQLLTLVHQHVARAASHEQFDAGNTSGVGVPYFLDVVIGGTQKEGMVHVAVAGCVCQLFLHAFQCHRLRHHIGHVHYRGHTTCCSSCRFRVHGSLSRKPGITHVYVVINDTGEQQHSAAVHHLCPLQHGYVRTFINAGDAGVLHHQRAGKSASFIAEFGTLYDDCLLHDLLGLMWVSRRRITPNRASLNMPPLILLVPSSRLIKMTGTSFTLNPRHRAEYFISIWKA